MLIKSIISIIFFNLYFMVKCEFYMIQSAFPIQNQPMYQEQQQDRQQFKFNDENMMHNYQFSQHEENENQILNMPENNISEKEFEKLFLKYLKQKMDSDSIIIPNRDKKSKFKANNDDSEDSNSETEPLVSHRRKTFLDKEEIAQKIDNAYKVETCSTTMMFEPDKIIDTKNSVANGAVLISIEMVNLKSISSNINDLQGSCRDLCCDSDECDSALLSLNSGSEGYRCYLFKCSGKCLYVKHKDYVVIRMKSQDQINPNTEKISHIKTGESPPEKTTCNSKYEFTCVKSAKCIAIYDTCDGIDHCDDKSDEFNCTNTNDEKKIIFNDMYNMNEPKKLNDEKKKPKNNKELNGQDDETSAIDTLIENNKNLEDDYDDFKLLKEQSLIVDHLKELEDELFSNKKKPKVVFETPKGYLDSFMKPKNNHLLSNQLLERKSSTKISTNSLTTKSKFHDDHDSIPTLKNQNIDRTSNDNIIKAEDAIYFKNKEAALTSSSNLVMAIVILLLGIGMTIGCFGYLLLSTKYMTKRIKWLNKMRQEKKNVDVDGDYLINGMYL